MLEELLVKISQIEYEISLLKHSEEDLTGLTMRVKELKELLKESGEVKGQDMSILDLREIELKELLK